jgi:hypothetical protein
VETDSQKKNLKENYSTLASDELLRMHAEGTLTELAYSVLEEELTSREVPIPERPIINDIVEKPHPVSRSIIVFLKEHWQGKRKLSSAFWRVGVAGTLFIFIALLAAAIAGNLLQTLTGPPNKSIFYITYFVVLGVWQIFAWVSIWRCSKNTKWIVWTYSARLVVIAFALLFILNILQLPLVMKG